MSEWRLEAVSGKVTEEAWSSETGLPLIIAERYGDSVSTDRQKWTSYLTGFWTAAILVIQLKVAKVVEWNLVK